MNGQEAELSTGPRPGFFYGYYIVIASFLIMLVMYGVYYAFGVFFKPVLTEFGWSRAMTSGAFSLSSIVMGLLAIAVGLLTDKFGARIVMTVCGLLVGLGYFLMSQISAIWHLYLFYGILVGAGMGGSFVPMVTAVARWFVERRSVMTGIVTAGIGLGALAGPPVATAFIENYGWRVCYMILGITVLVVVVLCAQFMRAGPGQMGLVPDGGDERETRKLNHANKGSAEGLSLKEAACTRQFWLFFGMFVCFGFCLWSVMVHIVPHVIDLGISASTAAGVLATIGGTSIVAKVLFGRLGDVIGSRQVFIVCFMMMSASLFWLASAKVVWMLFLIAAIFGVAYGGNVVSMSPLVAMLFGLRSHGLITGVISFSFTIGGSLGPFLTGYMFDATGSYRRAFLFWAILGAVGLVLTLMIKPIREEI